MFLSFLSLLPHSLTSSLPLPRFHSPPTLFCIFLSPFLSISCLAPHPLFLPLDSLYLLLSPVSLPLPPFCLVSSPPSSFVPLLFLWYRSPPLYLPPVSLALHNLSRCLAPPLILFPVSLRHPSSYFMFHSLTPLPPPSLALLLIPPASLPSLSLFRSPVLLPHISLPPVSLSISPLHRPVSLTLSLCSVSLPSSLLPLLARFPSPLPPSCLSLHAVYIMPCALQVICTFQSSNTQPFSKLNCISAPPRATTPANVLPKACCLAVSYRTKHLHAPARSVLHQHGVALQRSVRQTL